MYKLLYKILPILILIITIFSVQQWLAITITSTFIAWTINFLVIFIILKLKNRMNDRILREYLSTTDTKLLHFYFIWMLLNSIRGAFIAENYWEYKQLISGILSLSLPIIVYIYSIPSILNSTLKYWFRYALIVFIIIIPFLGKDAYHFYLGPIFLTGCFIPILPKKWRIIIGGLLTIMLFIDLGARSQVIKSAIVLIIAIGICFRKLVTNRIFQIVHWSCYILPIILLYLGITGKFNIFEDLASNEGKYTQTKIVDGEVKEEDLSVDTRTFIYKEVITSAIRHGYVIWGRTPARGNDSVAFGAFSAEELKTGKYERHCNELCHTNIFTWLGLIGVILYSLIYLRSSYLAVYRSNNIYIRFLGCFIAFRWAYGWIEDFNYFNIMNISLWMIIAMGLSKKFRNMTNIDFQCFIKNIFTQDEKDIMAVQRKIH